MQVNYKNSIGVYTALLYMVSQTFKDCSAYTLVEVSPAVGQQPSIGLKLSNLGNRSKASYDWLLYMQNPVWVVTDPSYRAQPASKETIRATEDDLWT